MFCCLCSSLCSSVLLPALHVLQGSSSYTVPCTLSVRHWVSLPLPVPPPHHALCPWCSAEFLYRNMFLVLLSMLCTDCRLRCTPLHLICLYKPSYLYAPMPPLLYMVRFRLPTYTFLSFHSRLAPLLGLVFGSYLAMLLMQTALAATPI